jgi:hypothetical protein
MKIDSINHVVFTVKDINATCGKQNPGSAIGKQGHPLDQAKLR